MKITEELILAGMSDGGAWTGPQFALLGLPSNPSEGWKKRVIGKEISEGDARDFVRLKNSSNLEKRKAAARGAKQTPSMF